MLFNSISFAIFFTFVYLLYLGLNHRDQNRVLLAASYLFYGAWDWRFLVLLFLSTCLDYFLGKKIAHAENPKSRKALLILSLIASLSILGFFKYFNFFAGSLDFLLQKAGFQSQLPFLQIILPVGVSFYTFQTMSYIIDVYRGNARPFEKFFDFALFVAFFPQLVAGPIEKAAHMQPQILQPREVTLSKVREGAWLIFWGLFKKVAIADNMASIASSVFDSSSLLPGYAVWIGVYAFAIQIYCDFSGYSDMARGLARVMGFDLMVNFNKPYASTNPQEFWQRWHISLSRWLKEYLYIPLGGNRGSQFNTARNLMLTMLIGGLWHGAAWTFVVWGGFHGTLLVIYHALKDRLEWAARIPRLVRVIFFFHIVCISWVFFRAQSMTQAFALLRQMFFQPDFPGLAPVLFYSWQSLVIAAILLAAAAFYALNNRAERPRWSIANIPMPPRIALYVTLCAVYLLIAPLRAQQFIYFQF